MRSVAKLPQDFADLLIELCEAKAEFLLVCGWAVILYGHVRATDDMDVRPTFPDEFRTRICRTRGVWRAPSCTRGESRRS